jgi:translation initiation factor 1
VKTSDRGGLVYSTGSGRTCPGCRRPVAECVCNRARPVPAPGQVRVSRETKGRGGRCVTVVRGLPLSQEDLTSLAKRLRTACSSGGTVKDGVIEVQGDHCDKIMASLAAEGLAPKRAGG